MSGRISFLHRYRWWILFGSASIGFILIYVLAANIFNGEDQVIQTKPLTTAKSTIIPSEPSESVAVIATSTLSQEPVNPTLTPTPEANSRQLAFVTRVIDGDSIEVILDGESFDVRYIGIDAPEIGMPLYQEATAANERLVANQIVELESDISDLDKFGRLLRYVYLPEDRLVNAELVAMGMAQAITYPPDNKYQEVINSNEAIAKISNLGLWAQSLTPSPELAPPTVYKAIQVDPSCSQFNAPGNDNENKNGEYVCLVNPNPDPVNLIGWSIQDNYGWIFNFPAFQFEGKSKLRVFTGCGNDSFQELYWCKDETAVWNNDGDCVYLKDPDGILEAEYCY